MILTQFRNAFMSTLFCFLSRSPHRTPSTPTDMVSGQKGQDSLPPEYVKQLVKILKFFFSVFMFLSPPIKPGKPSSPWHSSTGFRESNFSLFPFKDFRVALLSKTVLINFIVFHCSFFTPLCQCGLCPLPI